jgi:hypothetical protein
MDSLEFVEVVARHWVTLAVGCLLAALVLAIAKGRGSTPPWRLFSGVLGLFVAVALFLTWSDEHESALDAQARLNGLTTDVRFLTGQVKAKDALLTVSGIQNSQRQAADVSRETENQAVQQTMGECQADLQRDQEVLNQCLTRLGGSSKPRSWTFEVTPAEESKKTAAHSATFVALTNRAVSPLKALILCRGPFTSASPRLLGSSAIKLTDAAMKSPSSFRFTLESPSWTPEAPLVLDVFFNGEDPAPCTLQRN